MTDVSDSTAKLKPGPSTLSLGILVAFLYIADQVTKWLARINILPQTETQAGEIRPFIDGFWYFNHAHNRGIAFGMFTEQGWANVVFGIVALGAIIAILVLGRKGAFPGPVSRTAAALLVAGILGNLTDRLLRGHVTDFLLFDLKFWTKDVWFWPSFNIADACICVAAGLLILSSFLPEGRENPDA